MALSTDNLTRIAEIAVALRYETRRAPLGGDLTRIAELASTLFHIPGAARLFEVRKHLGDNERLALAELLRAMADVLDEGVGPMHPMEVLT